MQTHFTCRSETWAAGGTRPVPLTTLPPGKRVRAFKLYFDLSGTKDAADTLTGDNFARSVNRIQIGEYVSIAGESLWELNKELFGRVPTTSGDIPGSGTTFDMEFPLYIPFRDPRQTGSDDGSMPCELFDTLSIQITFAAATFAGVGNLLLTAGSVYVLAEIVEESAVPQVCRLHDFLPGSLTFNLEPGVYKSLFLLDGGPNTNGSITVAEVTAINMTADGEQPWNAARHESIVAAYNDDVMIDAAGFVTNNAASRLGLAWHDRFGKSHLTKQIAIEKGGQVQIISGSITAGTMTVVAWRALPKSEAAVKNIATAIGETDTATGASEGKQETPIYLPSTATKAPLGSALKKPGSRKHRIAAMTLPGHLRRASKVA